MKRFRKHLLFILCIVLLGGCARTDEQTFAYQLDQAVAQAIGAQIPESDMNNCVKTYYSYYRNNDIGKIYNDAIYNEFNINGNVSTLALDVESIVTNQITANSGEKTVRKIVDVADPIYEKSGEFVNSSHVKIPYRIQIAKVNEENEYIIYIQSSEFMFVSQVSKGSCADTLYDMLILLRSCNPDTTRIILDYGSESLISTGESIITLFEDVLPASGYVIDYIDSWKDDTSFIIIDPVEEDDSGGDYEEDYNDDDDDYQEEDTEDEDTGENEEGGGEGN
ncbi:MAG: hypothetical protein IJM79_05335 [Erysipelotrichaceae bacterium]|nr:hypothetical protein [Erysipelotrichaceae bacterium]